MTLKLTITGKGQLGYSQRGASLVLYKFSLSFFSTLSFSCRACPGRCQQMECPAEHWMLKGILPGRPDVRIITQSWNRLYFLCVRAPFINVLTWCLMRLISFPFWIDSLKSASFQLPLSILQSCLSTCQVMKLFLKCLYSYYVWHWNYFARTDVSTIKSIHNKSDASNILHEPKTLSIPKLNNIL